MKTILLFALGVCGLTACLIGATPDKLASRADEAVSVLSKERRSPTDIHIYGALKGGDGFLTWKAGLTLREAISAAGGFQPVAGGVRVYTADSKEKQRQDIRSREFLRNPKLLDYVLEKGDGVHAWEQLAIHKEPNQSLQPTALLGRG